MPIIKRIKKGKWFYSKKSIRKGYAIGRECPKCKGFSKVKKTEIANLCGDWNYLYKCKRCKYKFWKNDRYD